MKKTISIDELSVGMRLTSVVESTSNLKVKSTGTIKSQATIDNLKKRGVLSVEIELSASSAKIVNDDKADQKVSDTAAKITSATRVRDFEKQQQDLAAADKLYTNARAVQTKFLRTLKSGEAPNFNELSDLTQDIIDSVFDNQEALSCLVMIKENDENLAQHSLDCSVLLSIFAIHLNLSQSEIEDITLAGLLMDVGMALLPSEIVNTELSMLDAADFSLLKTHIEIGLEIIQRYSDLPPLVEEITESHHERIDGSGYPKGNTEQSVAVQMAAIVDTYNSMVSKSKNKMVVDTQSTLEMIQSDPGFDSALVEEFIRAIGLYPVGTLVQLRSGTLAMVVQANKENRLKPKVLAFYDISNGKYLPIKIIDLNRSKEKISVAVRPEEFDINLPKFFRSTVLPE